MTRPVAQRESTRLITGRRRFDSFRADWIADRETCYLRDQSSSGRAPGS